MKNFKCLMPSFMVCALGACSPVKDVKKEVVTAPLSNITQSQLDVLAQELNIEYQPLSNVETNCPDKAGKVVKHCYSATIEITSPINVLVNEWQINYSQVYPAYAAESEQLSLVHLNGDIHQISPKANFSGFKANQALTVQLWIASTVITESELMPNYWLSADQLTPAVIESTKTRLDAETQLEIQPYINWQTPIEKRIKSAPSDINAYASAQWLYDHNADTDLTSEHIPFAIIPTPKSIKVSDESKRLVLESGIDVSLTSINITEIDAALDRLAKLGVTQQKQGKQFSVSVDNALVSEAESYLLTINDQGITIIAADNAGAFYGVQSVAGLLTLSTLSVPYVEIKDQPHYKYRGQHLDVGRNFHDKAMVLRLIEQMAAYKLNKLHMHLAEDEGWRIELPSLPELTEIGGKRCMSLTDKHCLQPQLGGAGASERDGYYSTEDYIEILTYAKRHHIQVIPSLDMPGHSRAAVKAMEARYQRFIEQENEVEATRYLLSDFNDTTKYRSIQNYNDNTLNVCMESTYSFVDRVLDDLISLHQQAEHPLQLYHIGADETAGAWLESPQCQALINDKSNEVHDAKHLGAHFIERVANMIVAKGIAVGGWNDGLGETNVKQMPEDVYSYIWGTLPGGAHQQVSEQARRGWKVVLSIPDVFYFDFPYEVDPKERGYNWASRRVDTRNIFNFMPDNLPINAEFRLDTLGKTYAIDDTVQKNDEGDITHQPMPNNYHVAGIQGQLWSETVRSEQQAEYMIFPRLLAFAEKAWHSPNWHVPYNYKGARYDKDSHVFTKELQTVRDQQWQLFSNTIAQKELIKLDALNVFYRVPTIGAKVIDGKLHLNSSLSGLPLEYQTEDGTWHGYLQPVAVSLPVNVRARSADGKRAGRSLTVN
ncbi:family 20 glycosylhydrolase [Thalassotalea profundi]|uniref:beta-N-acetylhexosaminidase n=1 Tax=Thalassotalea profundi TaxID=2036687 RepID=A0ABQ3ISG1_9GAMM|nr:family 20 glycosylhydrolase [Thalassotalea profundi]GHE89859.1 beta-N-acetylhexosaminidase [Thalassotalea profundi]